MVKNIKLFIVGLICLAAAIALIVAYALETRRDCSDICEQRT